MAGWDSVCLKAPAVEEGSRVKADCVEAAKARVENAEKAIKGAWFRASWKQKDELAAAKSALEAAQAMHCTSRMPAVGDAVKRLDGARVTGHNEQGEAGAWTSEPDEVAFVVAVDKDGDFKLKNA